MRAPGFIACRSDKSPKDCVREGGVGGGTPRKNRQKRSARGPRNSRGSSSSATKCIPAKLSAEMFVEVIGQRLNVPPISTKVPVPGEGIAKRGTSSILTTR